MPRVSSAPEDAAKSAAVPVTGMAQSLPEIRKPESVSLYLAPSQIQRTPVNGAARPGPNPPDEQKAIEGLARDLRDMGQIVPLLVGEPLPDGRYPLIDGGRRLEAAELLTKESGADFPLECVIRSGVNGDYLRAAIHANIKRRGLTALQFAYLCKELRAMHKWSGTAEVARYLGVSRAMVSQHDKLLRRPNGMSAKAYEELLSLVQTGRTGADTAFYTLTHIEPDRMERVLERAQELAQAEQPVKAATGVPEPAPDAPRAGKRREKAVKTETAQAKAAEPVRRALPAGPAARVEKKHIRKAAEESRAVKSAVQRTMPEFRALFEKLRDPVFPDPMRSFISTLAGTWWNGIAPDRDVIAHWTQIAVLVEQAQERRQERSLQQRKTAKTVKADKYPARDAQ